MQTVLSYLVYTNSSMYCVFEEMKCLHNLNTYVYIGVYKYSKIFCIIMIRLYRLFN